MKNRLFKKHPVEITIDSSLINDVAQMARSAHPKEMFAFLASSKGERKDKWHIDEIHLQAYNASEDSASVLTWNLPMTTSIIGTIHSHPGGSVRPSEQDLHFYSKLGFVHAIIAEPYTAETTRFYDKKGTRIEVKILHDNK